MVGHPTGQLSRRVHAPAGAVAGDSEGLVDSPRSIAGVEAVALLRERGVPEAAIQSILSHADHLDVPRSTKLELTLAAVDETSGFVTAVALVRPSKCIDEVTPTSVKKKMKDKAFARGVNRDDVIQGAEALGIALDEHIAVVLGAMQHAAGPLGLAGTGGSARASSTPSGTDA